MGVLVLQLTARMRVYLKLVAVLVLAIRHLSQLGLFESVLLPVPYAQVSINFSAASFRRCA